MPSYGTASDCLLSISQRHVPRRSVEPREGVAREHRLRDGAAERNHGEPAVLQLLQAHLLLALLVLRQELDTEAVVAGRLERAPLIDLLCAAELDDGNPENN